ncbi:MAG: hypothetical protein IAI48_05725 [Candidatus Eremiobacteraeota bacterium]|nr:hypothetical protein [Candidatus Eremiobacteraeota bacterium]
MAPSFAADGPLREDDAQDLVRRVATRYAQSARGVIGVRSQSLLVVEAPLFKRRIANDGWFVFVDGVLEKSKDAPDPRQPPLRDPYRTEYLGEYVYAFTSCRDCRPGTEAVAFSSPIRDVRHASGTLVIDTATALIVAQTETPYKLPWPTKSGDLVATWGTTDGGWFPKSITGSFVGKIGPFVGHARYAQTLSPYRRFEDVATATAALSQQP